LRTASIFFAHTPLPADSALQTTARRAASQLLEASAMPCRCRVLASFAPHLHRGSVGVLHGRGGESARWPIWTLLGHECEKTDVLPKKSPS
jgi:hypothetical protein